MLYSFSLGYGAGNANVTSANDSVNGNWVFTYDYLNRLSTSNQNSGQEAFSYGYDPLGNRTSQTQTAGSCCGNLSLSYAGNNNRMSGYSYDAAGDLLSEARTRMLMTLRIALSLWTAGTQRPTSIMPKASAFRKRPGRRLSISTI